MRKNYIPDLNLYSNIDSISECNDELDLQAICHVLKAEDQYFLRSYKEYCDKSNNYNRRILLDRFVFEKPHEGQTRLSDEMSIDINIANEHFVLNIKKHDYEIYLEEERKLNTRIDKLKSQHPNYSIEKINKLIAYKLSIFYISVELMVNTKKQINVRFDIDISIKKDKHYYRRGLILLKGRMKYYKQTFPEFSENRLYSLVSFSYFY